MRTIENSRKIT